MRGLGRRIRVRRKEVEEGLRECVCGIVEGGKEVDVEEMKRMAEGKWDIEEVEEIGKKEDG
ncbi:hypothetical protein [Bacillus sp. WP8]|uniref:hypothetical protein n=1 Tax=Bacillus sp. WP8 TaxID=756828 RepID=UPI001642752E|nr:hypothetical protein [Bacillus sp. WP8]